MPDDDIVSEAERVVGLKFATTVGRAMRRYLDELNEPDADIASELACDFQDHFCTTYTPSSDDEG